MLPRRLRLSLLAAQLVGAATLVRSVAYDRWITVLAAILLMTGAAAAGRHKTWGVGLALTAAAWFPMAWAIGIAPPWFCLVGLVGALPFAFTSRAMARFDARATTLLAATAGAIGVLGALAWKNVAWWVFTNFPTLRPSFEANHGLLVAALVAAGLVAGRSRLREVEEEDAAEARVRVGSGVRVAEGAADEVLLAETAAEEEEEERPRRRAEG